MMDPQTLPLRDIHFPPDPSWWPPAPGWWVLAGCALCALVFWIWRRRRARLSAIDYARRELDALRERAVHEEAPALLRELSILLRRVAVSRFARREIAGVTGIAWLEFLDRPLAGRPFSTGAGRILLDGPYRRNVPNIELAPLFDLCRHWIAAL
ncbi:MAG: DUF4381 domain-containing protein [Gammaproteobacteria bacterium]|nr:DUF4381 domain-containing protein [Gammaproteobacteria bacterium]